jgi:hypothetical protein
LITSAGARTRHDAISATADAEECIRGSGKGSVLEKIALVLSYVEKNIPAAWVLDIALD